jgi:hypothetical protein
VSPKHRSRCQVHSRQPHSRAFELIVKVEDKLSWEIGKCRMKFKSRMFLGKASLCVL